MEELSKALIVHSRHMSTDVQRILAPAWEERLWAVFARLWRDKEKDEFSLLPYILQADASKDTATHPVAVSQSTSQCARPHDTSVH